MKRILSLLTAASLLAMGVGISRAGTAGATRITIIAPSNTTTSVSLTNMYATTTNGTVYLITNVVTTVTTNSIRLYPPSDNAAQVIVFNRMAAGDKIFVSAVNPVTNGQGFVLAGQGSLTFPLIAGGAVPSTLYAICTNVLVATNAVETEVWDSNTSK